VGFVVDKVALGQVFSEYFGFPANHHSIKFSIIIITRVSTIGHSVADVPSGPSLDSTPHYAEKKRKERGTLPVRKTEWIK
jgi:hypothetical protein